VRGRSRLGVVPVELGFLLFASAAGVPLVERHREPGAPPAAPASWRKNIFVASVSG
jgi:hypothetical protein